MNIPFCTFCKYGEICLEAWRETACSTWNPDREKLDSERDESIRRQWAAHKKRERRRARDEMESIREP